jgi:Fibronectin type III domain
MMRSGQRVGYWSAGLALAVSAAYLGLTGHGVPSLRMQMLNGEAWLSNVAEHSVSLLDGYPGKVTDQVGVGLNGQLQVVNTPGGAVVSDQDGHLVKVSNDTFTTSSPVEVFSGGATTAAAGQNALYAVDEATGQIRQLNGSGPQLVPVGSLVSVHAPVTSPVVAPDGSLYVAIPSSGSVGHVINGRLVTIKRVGRPGSALSVVLAGSLPVAADLTTGTLQGLGAASVTGTVAHLPADFGGVQVAGSDIDTGLVAVASDTAVESVDVADGATSVTPLPYRGVRPTAAAMQGRVVVLIDGAHRDVLLANTATRQVRQITMPRKDVPNQLVVQDRLVFVNASGGPEALVINGYDGVKRVTKYTAPPVLHRKPVRLPSLGHGPPPVHHGPPRRPGAPQDPVATPGNALADVGWGAAPDNGSAISRYLVSWTGSNGSSGHTTVPGSRLGAVVRHLSNGVPYVFTVTARNAIGTGPAARTARVTPSSKVPNAPARPTVSTPEANGSVTLQWAADDNGYRIRSYTVWQVGDNAPLLTGVTGTTATVGPGQGLVAGTPVQFEISAIGTSGATGALSQPSAAVTPYLPPGQPTVVPVPAQAGTSAVLQVSCPEACENGRPPATYQVTLAPAAGAIAPVRAVQGGTVNVTLNGLAVNTAYTAQVTVTDTAGTTGQAAAVAMVTDGPPAVAGVAVTGTAGQAAVNVTANVGTGGLATTCQVAVAGVGNAAVNCDGATTVDVPRYDTQYAVTYSATNADGTTTAAAVNGTSGLKALFANATDAFGTCAQYPTSPYCGANSSIVPGPEFTKGGPAVAAGTEELAGCWTTGGMDYGNTPAWKAGSNVWVFIPAANGYMSILWFPNPGLVTAGLPQEARC